MLKKTKLLDKPVLSKNNNGRLTSKQSNKKNKIDRFDGNTVEYRKLKAPKLSKSKKSKSEKLAKSKILAKTGNSPNFGTKKARPSC